MLTATLIISQPGQATQKVESHRSITSLGSALDNNVCFEDNGDVALYHAVIARRDDDYWLSDLGSRQGTRVNGEPVVLDRELADGDRITLGVACVIEFYSRAAPSSSHPASAQATSSAASEVSYAASSAAGSMVSARGSSTKHTNETSATGTANAAAPESGGRVAETEIPGAGLSPATKIGLGIGAGLVLTSVAALLFLNPFSSGCQPSVRLLSPLNGATLRTTAKIRVEAHDEQCIKRVSYQLDGQEIASAFVAPYEAELVPARLARFGPGRHVLTATMETTESAPVRQPGEILVELNFSNEGPDVVPSPLTPSDQPVDPAQPTVSAADVQAMAERLSSQITEKSDYVFDREMITRIQARTAEFAAIDAPARVARQRQLIVRAFSAYGIKPLVGFVLALSRSKLSDGTQTEGADWWRIPPALAQRYAQSGASPAELNDPRHSAEIAAVYLKELLGVFDGNFDLAVACYGLTLAEAGTLEQQLKTIPAAERRNFWLLVTRGLVKPEQGGRLVDFYAAGIVGENPQRFGAASTRQLSALDY